MLLDMIGAGGLPPVLLEKITPDTADLYCQQAGRRGETENYANVRARVRRIAENVRAEGGRDSQFVVAKVNCSQQKGAQ